MKALLLLVLVVVLVGGGLRLAGVRLPLLDYPIGPVGEGHGPFMPDIRIEQPNFEDRMDLP
jgi:hypothetical protein